MAVMFVLFSHYSEQGILASLNSLVPWGHFGVRIFFVLSGFLITSILLDCREQIAIDGLKRSRVIIQFYIRRVLRIFPLFYLTLLILFLFDVGNIKQVIIYHFFYLSNLSRALWVSVDSFQLIDASSAHFWTLAVEEQFYLIWPALALFSSKRKVVPILIGLIFFAVVFRSVWFILGYNKIINYLPTGRPGGRVTLCKLEEPGGGVYSVLSQRINSD